MANTAQAVSVQLPNPFFEHPFPKGPARHLGAGKTCSVAGSDTPDIRRAPVWITGVEDYFEFGPVVVWGAGFAAPNGGLPTVVRLRWPDRETRVKKCS